MASMGRPLDEDPQYAGVEEIELFPCPFCGGNSITVAFNPTEGEAGLYIVSCDECGVAGCFRDTRNEAVAAWNRRNGQ